MMNQNPLQPQQTGANILGSSLLAGTPGNQQQVNTVASSSASDAAHALVDELLVSVTEIKHGLEQLLVKVDSGVHVNSLLDSLSVTSGQMNMLCRKLSLPPQSLSVAANQLPQSKYSLLNNIVFFPQNLSIEEDVHLAQLTEDRARRFDHELVPLYLRTKLIPSLENKVQILAEEAAAQNDKQTSSDPSSNPNSSRPKDNTDLVKRIMDDLTSLMTEIETELRRSDVTAARSMNTCTPHDTAALLSMVTEGRFLKGPMAQGFPHGGAAGMKGFPHSMAPYAQLATHPQQQPMPMIQPSQLMAGRGNIPVGSHQIPPSAPTTIVKPIIR